MSFSTLLDQLLILPNIRTICINHEHNAVGHRLSAVVLSNA